MAGSKGSNAINTVATNSAIEGLDKLISRLDTADAAILKISSDALVMSANVSKVKTPGGLNNQLNENKALTDELNRQAKIVQGLETAIVKLNTVKAINNKMTFEQKVATQQANAEGIRQAKIISDQVGAYDKLSTKLLIAQRAAKDIGAEYGASSKQFIGAANNVKILETEVRNIDRALGDNRRNVGNYTGGYNALGTSISRLAQELPNAGQSFQIFALSIGNNFAQVKDAINDIVEKNKDLAASGQPTKSVFKEIGKEIFSLNTAFYIGIALFIAYSKEIGEFLHKISSGNKTLNVYAESLKSINDITKEATKNASQELQALQGNLAVAKDTTLTVKEREIAYKNLNDQYPFYFENLTKEQVLAGDTAAAEKALTEAILSRAKANAAVGKITENQGKIIDLEEKKIQLADELTAALSQQSAAVKRAQSGNEAAALSTLGNSDRIRVARRRIADVEKEINDINAVNTRLTNYSLEQQKKAIGLDYQKEKSAKAKNREDLKALELAEQGTASLIDSIKEQIEFFKKLQTANTRNFEQYTQYQKVIDGLTESLKHLTEGQEALRESAIKGNKEMAEKVKSLEAAAETQRLLEVATESYINTIANSTLGDLGLGSLQKFFDGTFLRLLKGADTLKEKFAVVFESISDVAIEVFSKLEELQNANVENQIARLGRQRDIALAFEGQTAEGKAEIQKQYDDRERALKQRQAQAEKRNAIFKIIITTAQGVVSALAALQPALAITIAAIGAVEAGIVASTPIPQFKMGGTHKGGLMMVNDAGGSDYKETVITPDGKSINPEGRNVIMNAPAGTRIITPQQRREMIARQQLNRILESNGIASIDIPNPRQSESIDYDRLGKAVGDNIPVGDSIYTTYDDLGYRTFTKKANQRTELMNNHLRTRGEVFKR